MRLWVGLGFWLRVIPWIKVVHPFILVCCSQRRDNVLRCNLGHVNISVLFPFFLLLENFTTCFVYLNFLMCWVLLFCYCSIMVNLPFLTFLVHLSGLILLLPADYLLIVSIILVLYLHSWKICLWRNSFSSFSRAQTMDG